MDGKREGNGNGRNVQESSCMDGGLVGGSVRGCGCIRLVAEFGRGCVRPKSERTARPGAGTLIRLNDQHGRNAENRQPAPNRPPTCRSFGPRTERERCRSTRLALSPLSAAAVRRAAGRWLWWCKQKRLVLVTVDIPCPRGGEAGVLRERYPALDGLQAQKSRGADRPPRRDFRGGPKSE
jgi:hypothetical protein